MLLTSPAAPPRIRRAGLLVLFFISGFVALLYQVIWQRLLGLITGLDLNAATMIVTVFMLGMGLGSLAGGYMADRFDARRLLLVFAVAEAIVACFALGSRALYHDFFYRLAADVGRNPTLVGALAASTLLVPTACMGVTLPVLSKAVSDAVDGAAARIAGLYGWNTLGAAAGAWIGSAWLIRMFGFEYSLWIGASLNLLCAVSVLFMSGAAAGARLADGDGGRAPATEPDGNRPAWWRWPALYFLSGFVALGLEMVWFRVLGVTLKSTAFTFPLLLGFYLLGVGGGSLAARAIANRSRHPVRWFLAAQAAVPLYAGLSIVAFLWALRTLPMLADVRRYFGSYEPIDFAFNFLELTPPKVALYGGLPALLILPPTLLMGASFVFLQKAAHSDLGHLGRRVGWLQAANIMGSALGVALVGLLLLDRVGTPGTLSVLTVAAAVFLALAARDVLRASRRGLRLAAALACGAVAVVSALLIPQPASFWGELHGVPSSRAIHAEDGTGVAVLTSAQETFRPTTDVFVNGLGQSRIPFRGVHSFLGLVPVMLHPNPRRVAIIGLGSGDTAYAAAGRPETTALDCVEIIAGQIRTLRELLRRTGYPGLDSLLTDPRVQHRVGDGRRFLMRDAAGFDVIEADALRPGSAYAGHLYSREYFELVRSRLRPGGLAVTWAPTARIRHTFADVFPHVAAVPPMLIGANEPIAFDVAAIRDRAGHPQTVEHYRRAGIEFGAHIDDLVATFRVQPSARGQVDEGLLNTDLFPRDELRVPE